MPKIVGLASLYEPLEFLETKIVNFNQSDMSNVLIYWSDCSSESTWRQVETLLKERCKFEYRVDHHGARTTLYWTWNWILERTREDTTYFCSTNVDDLLAPDYFRKMASQLDCREELKILACPWFITETKGQQWPPSNVRTADPVLSYTFGHFPMWRSSLHKSVGLFNPRMQAIGDAEFWYRIKKVHGLDCVAIYPEVLGCYLYHGKNLFYTADQSADWALMPHEMRS